MLKSTIAIMGLLFLALCFTATPFAEGGQFIWQLKQGDLMTRSL